MSRRAPLAILVLLLAGCSSATLDVLRPVAVPTRKVVLSIRDATRDELSSETLEDFAGTISSELQDAGISVLSSGRPGVATVSGSIDRYDPGSRVMRVFVGFGFGYGELSSTWEVKDASGEVARCRIEGTVSNGALGGRITDLEKETGRALARFLRGEIQ